MIVPMKKVSLLMLDSQRKQALKDLRRLGLLHIEIREGKGTRLADLKEKLSSLEECLRTLEDRRSKTTVPSPLAQDQIPALAEKVAALREELPLCRAEMAATESELSRIAAWGEINPAELASLREQGITLTLYEMSPAEYHLLDESITTIPLEKSKSVIRFLTAAISGTEAKLPPEIYRVQLPALSTAELESKRNGTKARLSAIEEELNGYAAHCDSVREAITALGKEIEFENYASGMTRQTLSEEEDTSLTLAYFTGYLPAEDLPKLQSMAAENAWGMLAQDPSEEDDVPTKLHNNRFVSLVYPLTDFIGTVPGYFEYDISGWFLGFILVFFGIIFGDGGYGLLICAAAGALILKSRLAGKKIPDAFLLVALLGSATVLWGLITCTWFGLSADQLPIWLQKLSIPVISNVYTDRIWHPFWTSGDVGLTTAQNVQIVCFSLALVQLSVAHLKGAVRNRGSLKMLGDFGSIFQLIGIFYVVLSLVVNTQVFPLGLVIGGVPVGTLAIALVGVGFAMSFIFANYEGHLGRSILESVKNIVSVLLGVVNVFSDIVSYIRLWAVGLAGAAISATVNEMAGPLLGNFVFIIFAIILLVFGHGLNMILNVLSVIVHGVRLNTLEFSSHLDMSWSGHKYKPFKE